MLLWKEGDDAGYAEGYYFGRPGGYQHYVFGYVAPGIGALAYDQVPEKWAFGTQERVGDNFVQTIGRTFGGAPPSTPFK